MCLQNSGNAYAILNLELYIYLIYFYFILSVFI